MNHFRDVSVKKFTQISKKNKGMAFVDSNNRFFKSQITVPKQAMQQTKAWPQMYGSQEYRNFAKAAQKICVSFARKLGVPLSEEEAENMDLVLWAAVYPEARKGDPVTHYYHAHQESIISFVMYVSMPEPTTPLTLADPRGLPPAEDYEYVQDRGDLGVDGDPPFHRPVEFYAGEGDILIFPSYQIHKVPPHIGQGTRVVWPCNCELPRRAMWDSRENPLDGWLRFALTRWSAPGLLEVKDARPDAVQAYQSHAEAALTEAHRADDPYMKLWEVQNQLVAMLQFAPHDAQVWLQAGNLSARVAVLMAARGEGDYFPDTTTFLVRALHLDPSLKPTLKTLLKELSPKAGRHRGLEEGYMEAKKLPKLIKHLRSLKDFEFIQFLHADINGPAKCNRMCPASRPPPFSEMVTAGVFSSRVVIAPLDSRKAEEENILALAKHVLGDVSGQVDFAARPACWWRDQSASLAGVICQSAATIWFADPRGAWPELWAGSVPSTSASWPSSCTATLGTEPKAPFHQHVAVECSANEVMLFPAWLAHKPAPGPESKTKPFLVKVPLASGTMAGWSLPLLQPHCSSLVEKAGWFRNEL